MAECKFIEDLGMLFPKDDSPKRYRYYLVECPICHSRFRTRAKGWPRLKSCRKCSSGARSKDIYNRRHGLSGHPLYTLWAGIKARCINPNHTAYENYGGRGIKICDEWSEDFKKFYDWAVMNGYEKGLDIDRIDNDGEYSPENCRFVSRIKNCANQREMRKNNSTGYRGVFPYGKTGRFYARIQIDGKPVVVGVFDTKEEASDAYQKARAEKLAKLNEG